MLDSPATPAARPLHPPAWEDLRRRRPRTSRALAALWHRPLVVLLTVALPTTAVSVDDLQPLDLGWFVDASRVITSADVWEVFGDAGLQIGPLYLLVVGGVVRAAELVGLPPVGAVGAALAALLVWSTDAVTRRWAVIGGAPVTPARWAVGGALVGGGMLAQVSTSGHQEELLLALVLAAAAAAVTRGHAGRLGLLLALGAGVKTWAVLGGPLVLYGRQRRTVVVGALVACLGTAVLYLPFVLSGEFRTFEFSWGIAQGSSLLATVGALAGLDDWGLRGLQALAAGVAGVVVALRRHGSALAVVMTVVTVRLLLEPVVLVYYTAPLVLLCVLWCWTSARRPGVAGRALVLLVVPAAVLQPYLLGGTYRMVAEAALCVGLVLVVLLRERRPLPGPHPPTCPAVPPT